MSDKTVFIDARMFGHSGIGRYIAAFSGALSSEYRLIAGVKDSAQREEMQCRGIECEYVLYDASIYSLKEQFRGRTLIRNLRDRVDVCFFPQYNAPWNLPRHSVVMIYDFIQFEQPGYGSAIKQFAAWRILSNAIRKAGRIIAISEFTKSALRKRFPQCADKVAVIYPGLEEKFHAVSPAGIEAFRNERNVGRYLLCVGNKKPHKNFEFAIGVFEDLADEFPDLSLVLIGKRFPQWEPARNPRILDIESVSDEELSLWYAGAQALLHPSLAEGFGLTPLEAMRAGAPAIVSNRGALPEAVGDGAIVLDVGSTEPWKTGVRKLLSDSGYREEQSSVGAKRAAAFTWATSCEKLLRVISSSQE